MRAPCLAAIAAPTLCLPHRLKGLKMQLAIPPRVTDRAFARIQEIGGPSRCASPSRAAAARASSTTSGSTRRPTDDLVLEKDGARVLIDPVSLPFLAAAEIDFADELIGARFVVKNPNATTSCGCGTSFSI